MIGIFVGENGSMGFRYNRMYKITLEKAKKKPNWIWLRTEEGLYCPYGSMDALKRNWKIVG